TLMTVAPAPSRTSMEAGPSWALGGTGTQSWARQAPSARSRARRATASTRRTWPAPWRNSTLYVCPATRASPKSATQPPLVRSQGLNRSRAGNAKLGRTVAATGGGFSQPQPASTGVEATPTARAATNAVRAIARMLMAPPKSATSVPEPRVAHRLIGSRFSGQAGAGARHGGAPSAKKVAIRLRQEALSGRVVECRRHMRHGGDVERRVEARDDRRQQHERARRGDEGQLPAPDCGFAAGMGSFCFREGRERSALRKVAR